MHKIPVILDGDPGHDDAIAWMIAGSSELLDIKAVTTVAGNKDIENVTRNALNVCSLFHIEAPLGKGADGPLVVKAITAGEFHGKTGLDGADLPESHKQISELTAVELMIKVLEESDEPVVIFATGAQTNTASLLIARPDLKSKIKAFYIMGGGIHHGNWTPAAEFNILVDPEAADIVMNSGVPVVMAGLDVTEKALIYPDEIDEIRKMNTPYATIVSQWLDFFGGTHAQMGYQGWPLHDPCAVLALLHPEIFTFETGTIEIDLNGYYTRGETYLKKEGNLHQTIVDVDRKRFVEHIQKAVKSYGETL